MLKYHLGGNFKHVNIPKKLISWGSYTFVTKVVKKHEELFGEPVPKSDVHAPLVPGGHHEFDDSPFCDAKQTQIFMCMIGAMQWAISLGRINFLCYKMLSAFHALPRIGHLELPNRVYKFQRDSKKTSTKI
jgi:hypothetical protein